MSGGGFDFSAVESVSSFAQEDALIAGEEIKVFSFLTENLISLVILRITRWK